MSLNAPPTGSKPVRHPRTLLCKGWASTPSPKAARPLSPSRNWGLLDSDAGADLLKDLSDDLRDALKALGKKS